MLAKWLNMRPGILIFDEPTRGIDVGAKAEVHKIIHDFAAEGGSVLLISSDLPEVLALADRILVMREGRRDGHFRWRFGNPTVDHELRHWPKHRTRGRLNGTLPA